MFIDDLDDELLRANPITDNKPSERYYFDYDDRCIRAKGTNIGIFDQVELLAIIAGLESEIELTTKQLRAYQIKIADLENKRTTELEADLKYVRETTEIQLKTISDMDKNLAKAEAEIVALVKMGDESK